MNDHKILNLLGELDEFSSSGDFAGMEAHYLSEVKRLVDGATIWWSAYQNEKLFASSVGGLSRSEFERWQRSFLECEEYRKHPMWEQIRNRCGRVRTYRRHELVSNDDWDRAPLREFSASFGVDDQLACYISLGNGQEAVVAICKPTGELFSEEDRQLLHSLHSAGAAVHRQLLFSRGSHELTLRALAPRHLSVLKLLLQGASEKEIALILGKTPRTIHKYVENIYRAFGVSSRAALMALWIRR